MNKRERRLLRKYKEFGRKTRSFDKPVYQYDGRSLTWWDDLHTKVNGVVYTVLFQNLRFAYLKAVEDQLADHPYFADDGDLFESVSLPVYAKVGRSRKRVKYWRLKFNGTLTERKNLYNSYEREKNLLLLNSNIVVRPRFEIVRGKNSKFVHLQTSDEIASVEDFKTILSKCKALIKRERVFEELFDTSQTYTSEKWREEEQSRIASDEVF